jgi:hypothetical protein
MLQHRQIIQDWVRVENCEVSSSEYRTFDYHVVAAQESDRAILTIKCLNADATTVRRLDPNSVAPGTDREGYEDIAARRVRQLFANGLI